MLTELRFTLAISAVEAQRYYQGQARFVIAYSQNGQRIQFPAAHIRPFVDNRGVYGDFVITFDGNNKLVDLRRA